MAGAASILAPRFTPAAPSSGKVNLACCGIGNRGAEVVAALHATGLANIVALCDTDIGAAHTVEVLRKFPDVPRFRDFRQMFDKIGKDVEAVSVAVPDFSHFSICMLAMSLGKHVYCEKPMGNSFRQIELMMQAEKKYRVVTQMGNQGHSEASYFQFKAWTDAGIIKNVTKITAWMNMPRRWHGMKVSGLLAPQPVPTTLDWNAWLTTARFHHYNKGYVNGDWRSWFDFGNGALGDWGAHIIDTAHEFLHLGLPTQIDVERFDGYSPFIFPQASTLAFRFPARGAQPPLELRWYEGQTNLPPLPGDMGEVAVDPNVPLPSTATLNSNKGENRAPGKVIYAEGLTFQGGSHASTLQIIPKSKQIEMASNLPAVAASTSNHFKNFLLSCKGEENCRSPFAVAGPLCQVLALGVVAQRVNANLVFDPASKRIINHRAANELLAGAPPRKEWEHFYRLA
ncbi:MAG: Gfo/Idh/MocA family oxidoreductase [Pseudomonadota bacterium]|nr:Gfo/Idh/MocA family oxidoreductase [Pseudomonadota bacterium]